MRRLTSMKVWMMALTLPLLLEMAVWGQSGSLKIVPGKPEVHVEIKKEVRAPLFAYNGFFATVEISNPTKKDADITVHGQMSIEMGSNDKKLSVEQREIVPAGTNRQLKVFLPIPLKLELISTQKSLFKKGLSSALTKICTCSCEVFVNRKSLKNETWSGEITTPGLYQHICMMSPSVSKKIHSSGGAIRYKLIGSRTLEWANDVRCIVGCTAVWMTGNEWRDVSDGMKTALEDYERLGGTVVVAGELSGDAPDQNGASVKNVGLGRHIMVPDISWLEKSLPVDKYSAKLGGVVYQEPKNQVSKLKLAGISMVSLISEEEGEITAEAPNVMAYLIGVLIAVLILGPGVFWVCKLMKKPLLPLIVTPSLAIAGTVIMILAKLIANGFENECELNGLVWFDHEAGRICSYGLAKATFRSILPVRPCFGESSIVTGEGDEISSTVDKGTQSISGLAAKAATLPVAYDVRSVAEKTKDAALTAVFADGKCTVVNRLVPLKELVVVGPDGKWYGGVDVKAGETRQLEESGDHGKWGDGNLLSEAVSMVLVDTSEKAIWQLAQSGALPVGAFAAVTDNPIMIDYGFKADSCKARVLVLGTYGQAGN